VLGIGVNCRVIEPDAKRIDQPWADLYTITGRTPERNRLAALLIRHCYDMFQLFAASGLAPFESEWNRRHLYAERRVRLAEGDASVEGIVDGIDASGGLRLRTAGGMTRVFHSGEMSLRPAAAS
jgi:BirA family biotin operon repressor/biotin-[acetyl-CoA-carboxylase] ligase